MVKLCIYRVQLKFVVNCQMIGFENSDLNCVRWSLVKFYGFSAIANRLFYLVIELMLSYCFHIFSIYFNCAESADKFPTS